MQTGIVKPTLAMGKEIHELINYYAHDTDTGVLARPLKNIYENIRDFIVYVEDDHVLGCVCLHIYWDNLGEIRSLAVDPNRKSEGIGRKLIEAVEKKRVILKLLNYSRSRRLLNFSKKWDMNKLRESLLPKGAAWGECMNCPKYPDCDEVSMIKNIPLLTDNN